jgi:hypothetical protein
MPEINTRTNNEHDSPPDENRIRPSRLSEAAGAAGLGGKRPPVRPARGPALARQAEQLLRLLAGRGFACPCPFRPGRIALYRPGGAAGVTLGAGHARLKIADALEAQGLARWTPAPSRRLVITAAGEAQASTRAAKPGGQPDMLGAEEREGRTVMVNLAESPLAWLRRRKGPDGKPMIDAAAFAAGERLRRDLTIAGTLPSVSANWSASVAEGPRGAGRLDASEAMLAARQRVDGALRAVGPEMSGLLIDLCGFLKGLEQVERERGWPARSAKLILTMALARLAAHYGVTVTATGPERARPRHWRGENARPMEKGGDVRSATEHAHAAR